MPLPSSQRNRSAAQVLDAYAAAVRAEMTTAASVAHASAVLSSATFRSLAAAQPLEAMARLARIVPVAYASGARTIGGMFDAAYQSLQREYRNEYVFKNAVVSKVVFGRHKPTTASAILELPLGTSFADVVVFNGTSTVYEIKTDLDSFSRLGTQLADYCTRAEFVNVVVSEERAEAAAEHVPEHVGVLALRRTGAIRTVRDATSNLHQIRADHLFGTLRRAEAIDVLASNDIVTDGPDPATRWAALRDGFATLDPAVAHAGAVAALRRRGMGAAAVASNATLPRSTRALAYSAVLSRTAGDRLLERLAAPIPPVWGL